MRTELFEARDLVAQLRAFLDERNELVAGDDELLRREVVELRVPREQPSKLRPPLVESEEVFPEQVHVSSLPERRHGG